MVLASIAKRIVALLIDTLLLGFVVYLISAFTGAQISEGVSPFNVSTMNAAEMKTFMTLQISGILVQIMYFTAMESSEKQATYGKQLMGLMVTDLEGKRLTTSKALMRSITRLISQGFFFIGYFMAFFTTRKQTLHDLIAGTVVIEAITEIEPVV